MAENLKTVHEGEDILASVTNDNNQYLLSKLSDNALQVQNYVEGEVATIKSNVASVQATLQNNIAELENDINNKVFAFTSKSISLGVGTTNLTTYLPEDDLTYLVWVQADVKSTGNTECYVRVNTDIFPTATIVITDGDAGRESAAVGLAVVPVGKDKTITIANNGGLRGCKLLGYMRV